MAEERPRKVSRKLHYLEPQRPWPAREDLPPDDPTDRVIPVDYDTDPDRFAAAQLATARFLRGSDTHVGVARLLSESGCRRVLDIGGGNGALARLLSTHGVWTVVVDRADYVRDAPRPGARVDALALPFADETFDGAAALWMLYHLDDPRHALREAHRVLRPGGLIAVCAPSRFNDPELAEIVPGWGDASSFDAENGPEILASVFAGVQVEHWDDPMVDLPDRDAAALYLRGRGLSEASAAEQADRLRTPITITKRGMIAVGVKST